MDNFDDLIMSKDNPIFHPNKKQKINKDKSIPKHFGFDPAVSDLKPDLDLDLTRKELKFDNVNDIFLPPKTLGNLDLNNFYSQ